MLIQDGASSEFVTIGYTYLATSSERWIEVLPILNSHRNEAGYSVKVRLYLDEYMTSDPTIPMIYVDVPIIITVLGCEIK